MLRFIPQLIPRLITQLVTRLIRQRLVRLRSLGLCLIPQCLVRLRAAPLRLVLRCRDGSALPACLIAHPAHGLHQLRVLGVAFDLRPQPLHVDVDQTSIGLMPVPPDLLQ